MNTTQDSIEYYTQLCTVADKIVETCPLPTGNASVSSVGGKIFILTGDTICEFEVQNSPAFMMACSLMGAHITTLEEQQFLLSCN